MARRVEEIAAPRRTFEEMDGEAPDSTQDWLLPEHSRPPLIGELERRIDTAIAIARASEAAVMTVGAAALDAAEQARRAAELAQRASAAQAAQAVQAVKPAAAEPESSLADFTARADQISARLRKLQRRPLLAPSRA